MIMKKLFLTFLLMLAAISLSERAFATCQCTSNGLQTVGCVETVSNQSPCHSNCDCTAGRYCSNGLCHGAASTSNCECINDAQVACTEASSPYPNYCNYNKVNSNCQCSIGRSCGDGNYCGSSTTNVKQQVHSSQTSHKP